MTDLTTFKFNDLLPSSVKDAPKFKAASACLDRLFESFDERVKMMLIYSRVDELNNEQLDELAWQWNVGYFEGYSLAQTLDDKRVLIKNAIKLHWHKGTRWALESVPIYLGMPAFTVEWFEGDLVGAEMNPYEFDIAIDTSVRGASTTIHDDIRQLVNNIKNVRSYFRHIILIVSWNINVYYASVGVGINIGTIRPKDWKGGTTELKYGRAVGGYYSVAVHVKPKLWSEKEFTLQISRIVGNYSSSVGKVKPYLQNEHNFGVKKNIGIGNYAAITITVYPKALVGEAKISSKHAIGGYSAIVGRVNPMA